MKIRFVKLLSIITIITCSTSVRAEESDKKDNLKFSGFLQPQGIIQINNEAANPNPKGIEPNDVSVKPNGTTTNSDYFRLRRGRFKLTYDMNDSARFVLEAEPVPTNPVIARQVEAIGIAHWTAKDQTEFGAGIFKVPFGYEVLRSDSDRPFIERSWGEQNMTPGEFDTGARAYTKLHNVDVQFAVVNGVMQGEKVYSVMPDFNHGKDFYARTDVDFGSVDLGLSGTYGRGYLTNADKGLFSTYDRGGVLFETNLHYNLIPSLGKTKLLTHSAVGCNMDRGVRYDFALPDISNVNGSSKKELSVVSSLEQDFSKWVTLGFRFDTYTPDVEVANNRRDTYGLVSEVHFTKGLKLMVEADHAVDNAHKNNASAPNKKIETLSTVLQAKF